MGIGGYFAGSLLPRYGSRRLLLICNILALLFNLIKLIEDTAAIMIGRLMFGFTMGVATVCISKAINDNVPSQHQSQYGAFVNAGLGSGVCISNLLGLMIPINSDTEAGV